MRTNTAVFTPIAALFTLAASFSLAQAQSPAEAPQATTAAKQIAVSYTPSDRKWKFGLNGRSYDKVGKELQDLLTKALTSKGFTGVDSLSGSCCKIVIEVVEVSQHNAAFGKVGMDLVANLAVQDAAGKQSFSKVCRGESRTIGGHTWGGMLDMAEKLLVDDALKADDFLSALTGAGSR